MIVSIGRRRFVAGLGSAAITRPLAAEEREHTYRLGILSGATRQAPNIVAFFNELKVFGFIEGKNLKIVADGFGLRDDFLIEFASMVVKSAPDVILCGGHAAIRAARQSTQTIPIIGLSNDMVAEGFVRPGGNITGISILASELDGKRQDILMEAVPDARHIAVMVDATYPRPAELQALQNAAHGRGAELIVLKVGGPNQIGAAMEHASGSELTVLNVLASPLFSIYRHIVIERAAALHLPAIYEWPEIAEEGGLIAYGPRLPLMYRQAARLVVKVLRGVKPENISVEQPTKFDLVINLKTAKTLGLTIPQALLTAADEVIE